MLQLIWVYLFI